MTRASIYPPFSRPLLLGLSLAVAVSAYFPLTLPRPNPVATVPAKAAKPVIVAVTALGRLEPRGEVIRVSVSQASGSNRIDRLLVKAGDTVKRGQVIAVLDNREIRETALLQALRQVEIARSKLNQVKAGAKQGEIEAQKAAIARLEAQLDAETIARQATVDRIAMEVTNAKSDFDRYEYLYNEGAISAIERDRFKLTWTTAEKRLEEAIAARKQTVKTVKEQIQEARSTLDRIAEVRPVDVAIAEQELESALARVKQAQADLALTEVRSPLDSQVLKIHTRPGEIIDPEGIVELGQTRQMYAVAEVYESDIGRVRVGQKATMTLLNSSGTLSGTVEEIGLLVAKKDVLDTDPTADIDSRVVEARIRLDRASSQAVAGLSNATLKVRIPVAGEEIEPKIGGKS